jgi:hypothetical protein
MVAGVLEFTALGRETFFIHPGDAPLAVDHTGSGQKWRLVNDEPWKRAYVVFKEEANSHFIPDHPSRLYGFETRDACSCFGSIASPRSSCVSLCLLTPATIVRKTSARPLINVPIDA